MTHVVMTALLVGALAAPAGAQTPTVDELLALNVKSRGGAERLNAVKSRKVMGTITIQGQQLPLLVLAKRPNLMYQEMTLGDQRLVTAFDGKQAWAINPMLGNKPQPVDNVQADLLRDQAQFDGPLAYARQRGDTMEVVGREQVDGHDTWKLAITRENRVTHVFLDAKTGLERKVSATLSNEGMQVTVESFIADYQPEQGIQVPRTIRTTVGGQPQATVNITSVEFDAPIGDEQFRMPAQ
jgi:outer membrane lipoprotein-sorting protein